MMKTEKLITLRELSKMLGVPTVQLRRFCDQGLIRGVRRNRVGYRVLDEEQQELLGELWRLTQAGFSTAELKKYLALKEAGAVGAAERRGLLQTKKRQLWQKIEDLQAGIDYLERQEELIERETAEK